jgi:hypothetical protein
MESSYSAGLRYGVMQIRKRGYPSVLTGVSASTEEAGAVVDLILASISLIQQKVRVVPLSSLSV